MNDLSAAQKFKTITTEGDKELESYIYEKGYPLGMSSSYAFGKKSKIVLLNNHVDLVILYHSNSNSTYISPDISIVGFEIRPRSVKRRYNATSQWNEKMPQANSVDCSNHLDAMKIEGDKRLDSMETLDVVWTYSVSFEQSEVKWSDAQVFGPGLKTV